MKKRFFTSFGVAMSLVGAVALGAPHPGQGNLRRVATIALPGNAIKSFDISAISEPQRVYAFSDRSNQSVDFIDITTSRFFGRVGGFTAGGPNGLVAVGPNQFWAGGGNSNLRVIDIPSRKVVWTIDTGGTHRVDELAYDSRNHVVIAVNNDDKPPFVSFVSTVPPHRILGQLRFPQATDGLEQPVWNPSDDLVYLSVPVLYGDRAAGGVAVIDPKTRRLVDMIPVRDCIPAGLALGPNDQMLVGCSDDRVVGALAPHSLILDLRTHTIIAEIAQVGGSDEVSYDRGSGRYYLAAFRNRGGPVLGVVDAKTHNWLRNVVTGRDAHSVAVDARSGKVFVPVAANDRIKGCNAGCVLLFEQK